jgi:hypothetical protein
MSRGDDCQVNWSIDNRCFDISGKKLPKIYFREWSIDNSYFDISAKKLRSKQKYDKSCVIF